MFRGRSQITNTIYWILQTQHVPWCTIQIWIAHNWHKWMGCPSFVALSFWTRAYDVFPFYVGQNKAVSDNWSAPQQVFFIDFAVGAGINSTCDHWKTCVILQFCRHQPEKSLCKLYVPTQREIVWCFVWEHQIFTDLSQVCVYKKAKSPSVESISTNFWPLDATRARTGLKLSVNWPT